eukprot:TRINITY_DN6828_c0_g1_i2.p1 TRINITY_DN6828_c0_g1~~TRINITY_DN6828_c0_g1_i2.p1  ORF type:complete len:245 (-),score=85.70 TRINITY_DN6828_c0_g1_i2:84-818(-)
MAHFPHESIGSGLQVNFSSFSNEKSSHEKIINNHPFNSQCELIIPLVGNDKKRLEEKIEEMKKRNELKEENHCYFQVFSSLSIFLNSQFSNSLFKDGQFFAFSHRSLVDSQNSFTLLPNGMLNLSLDKNSFQQLGLDGKPSSFFPPKDSRYDVQINLLSPKFVEGNAYYERVKKSLDRLSNVKYFCMKVKDGVSSSISFPKDVENSKFSIVSSKNQFKSAMIPTLPVVICLSQRLSHACLSITY